MLHVGEGSHRSYDYVVYMKVCCSYQTEYCVTASRDARWVNPSARIDRSYVFFLLIGKERHRLNR